MRRRKQIKRVLMPEISLTSLIDVALSLLVIFMLTTPMLQTSLDIKLPQGKGSGKNVEPKNMVEIGIDKAGLIYLNGKLVAKKNLKTDLAALLKGGSIVTVRADGQVVYDHVACVLDILNSFSDAKVSLILQREL
jgi:biopolymer transport protein ExbD